jgi:hypothetical protein
VPTIAKENRPIAVVVHPQTFSELVTFSCSANDIPAETDSEEVQQKITSDTRAGMFLST